MGSLIEKMTELPQFRRFMKQLALMGAGLLLVAFVLRFAGVHFNNALFVVAFGTLAVVAFLFGYIFPYRSKEGNVAADMRLRPIWKFAMTVSGYTLAVLLMAALFALMHWPGGRVMFLTSVMAVAGCAIAWMFFFIQRNKQ